MGKGGRPPKRVIRIGMRVGRLVIVEEAGRARVNGELLFRCVCDCGGETVSRASDLRREAATSCGCKTRGNMARLVERARQADELQARVLELEAEVAALRATGASTSAQPPRRRPGRIPTPSWMNDPNFCPLG